MRKSISDTIRGEMKDLYDAGLINETTMRKFDKDSLEPAKNMSKMDVKRIREKNHVSQPVFASYLNVSPAAVKQWENGERKPSGSSARLLQLIESVGLEVFKPIQARRAYRKEVIPRASRKAITTRKSTTSSSNIHERRR